MRKIKDAFPFFKSSWVYLDSAATAQKPQNVITAIEQFYREEYATVHRGVYPLSIAATAKYDAVRAQVQTFLHAKEEGEIIFTKGTTEGINLVAHSFGKTFLNQGDEILLCQTEHHANILPWQILAEEKGVVLKIIPIDENGELLFDAFLNLLSSKTKLLSIAHMTNTTGTIYPIKEMIAHVHKVGGYALIDGAQAAAHLPIDVQDLDADFYLFSGHKVYGPTGIGVLYGKKELLEKMPPYQTGGDMVQKVSFEKSTYQQSPLKFEAGTPPIAEVIGLGAALSFIGSIGHTAIIEHDRDLLQYGTEQLKTIPGLKIIGTAKNKGPLISFIIPPHHPLDIGTLLGCKQIALRTGHLCAQPTLEFFNVSSVLRASFGIYTTREEIDLLIKGIREVVTSLN